MSARRAYAAVQVSKRRRTRGGNIDVSTVVGDLS